MEYEILLAFVLASTALAFAPGPDNMFVLTTSLSNGLRSGLATTAGLATGCLVHTTLLAFGVSAIIKANDQLFFMIKVFGALYLFYLAYKVYTIKDSLNWKLEATAKQGTWQYFKQGFIMNVLNPKVTIFFLAFFPAFLFSESLQPIHQFYVLGFLFIIVTLVVFGLIALLSNAISKYLNRHKGTELFFKWLQLIVFVGIGIYLLFSEK